ncbi:MAG: SdrD B-like domain-containing protein [Gemmobacter sp.]
MTKTSPHSEPVAGQELIYTLAAGVRRDGRSGADDVTVIDTLPAGVRFVSATSSSGSCSAMPAPGAITASGDTVECNLGRIANGSQQTVTIRVIPTDLQAGQELLNTAAVSTTTEERAEDQADNTDDLLLVVREPVLDLVINKTDDTDPVESGQNTAYRITVTNRGPSAAFEVELLDTFPTDGLSFVSITDRAGMVCETAGTVADTAGGTLTCTLGYMPANETRVIGVEMKALERGTWINSAVVKSRETTAGHEFAGNNSVTESTTVRERVDLVVSKTNDAPTPLMLREGFNWEITVENQMGTAEGVELTDILPANVEVTGAPVTTGDIGSCDISGRELSCFIGEMAPGDVVSVSIPVKVVSVDADNEVVSNTASVTTESFPDDPGTMTSTDTVTVQTATLSGGIFRDFDRNDAWDAEDTGVAGVTVQLTGTAEDGTPITMTTTTDGTGNYSFPLLPEGAYQVSYASPSEDFLTPAAALPTGGYGTAVDEHTIGSIAVTGPDEIGNLDFSKHHEPRIGLDKSVEHVVQTNGSYMVTYELLVTNPSLEPVTNIVIDDPLEASFGTYDTSDAPGSFSIVPVNAGGLTLDPGFEANPFAPGRIISGGTLAAGADTTVRLQLRVWPEVPRAASLTHDNTATVEAEGRYSGEDVDDSDSATVTPAFTDGIDLAKTYELTPAGGGAAAPGDVVTYTFEITNTGNSVLVDVTLDDPMDSLSGFVWDAGNPSLPHPELAPGDSITLNAAYTLTQDDIDSGLVENTATTTGLWGGDPADTVSDTDTVRIDTLSEPELELVKTEIANTISDPATEVDETITYGFTVTNTGNTTLREVVVEDVLGGTMTPAGAFTIGTLEPGADHTFQATYPVTQDDIDAGRVENLAHAEAVFGPGNTPISSDEQSVETPLHQNPDFLLHKELDPASLPEPAFPGDEIRWNIRVENIGNVTLENIVLTDPLPGAVVHGGIVSLPVGSVDTDGLWITYVLTVADIVAGEVVNQAAIEGESPSGTPSDPVPSGPDPSDPTPGDTVTPLPHHPAIALVKTLTTDTSGPLMPGDRIDYGFTIRNTGNLPLTNLVLTDILPGFVFDEDISGLTLDAPGSGGTTEYSLTGHYLLTQADIEAGEVENHATVTADTGSTTTPTVTDDSGSDFDNDEPTVAPLLRNPALDLVKEAVTTGLQTPPQAGDEITYTFAITNTGNVPLSNLALTDLLPGVTITGSRDTPLEVDQTDNTSFTGSYTLTQEDIDNGQRDNTAEVTGDWTNPDDPTEVLTADPATSDVTVPLDRVPGMTLLKTADQDMIDPAEVGDTITYTFVVENTGNVTLTDLVLSDPKLALDPAGYTLATLAPGAAETWVATYTVTQEDIDNGEVVNQATARADTPTGDPLDVPSGNDPDVPNDDPTVVGLGRNPAVTLVKTVADSLPEMPLPGEVIEFTFTVTNTGNVTLRDLEVADPLPGIDPASFSIAELAPGGIEVLTASYELTQDDIQAGEVRNRAGLTGDFGGTPGDPAGPLTPVESSPEPGDPTTPGDTVLPVPQVPGVELVKTAGITGLSNPPLAGEEVVYHFTIRNTGNVVLESFTMIDGMLVFTTDETQAFDLLPDMERGGDFAGTHALTQAEINEGGVTNTAEVVAIWRDSEDDPQEVRAEDTEVTDLVIAPGISLVKALDTTATDLSSPPVAGEVLRYRFEVRNTGNVTLTDLVLTDDFIPGVAISGSIDELAPGALDDTSFTAAYTLTQDDIERGHVENRATVTGGYTDEDGEPQEVSDESETETGDEGPTVVPLARVPAMQLVKTADPAQIDDAEAGDSITYTLVLTNTGNVTLYDIAITDPLDGITPGSFAVAELAPGADETFVVEYVVTQDDINRGQVVNQATARSTWDDGEGGLTPVEELSGNDPDVPNDDETVVGLGRTPALAVVKSAEGSPSEVGGLITYSFTVRNTGNVTLTDVTVTDPLPGLSESSFDAGTLLPGESADFTATYPVTQDDLDAGEVVNQATGDAVFDDGGGSPVPVTDLSGETEEDDDPTVTPLTQLPGIELVKDANALALTDPAVIGQEIIYSFAVTNTGNVTLTDVTLADDLPGLVLDGGPIPALAPGVTDDDTFTARYAITQDDITAGRVENLASVTGTWGTDLATGEPRQVGDESGVEVPVASSPAVALVKTASTSVPAGDLAVGDTISYAFAVTNTGNVPLTDLVIADDLPGIVLAGGPLDVLDPGETDSDTFTASYVITQADIDRGHVENTATVTGQYTDAGGVPVEVTDISGATVDDDDPTRVDLPQAATIELVKAADATGLQGPPQVGDEIRYAFAITNSGTVTLFNVELTDALPGIQLSGAPIPELAPGETDTDSFSATYSLTQEDLDAGQVENRALVSASHGDPDNPGTVTADSFTDQGVDGPTVVGIDQTPGIALVKTADDSGVQIPPEPGDIITYAFTVTNTGNVTLTDVTVIDDLPGLVMSGGPIPSLAPGAADSDSFTASYAITAEDIARTRVENQALAQGHYTTGDGTPATAEAVSGTGSGNHDITVVDIGHPELALTIGIDRIIDHDGDGVTGPGDEVVFRFTVENTGTLPLTEVNIDGSRLSLPLPGLSCQPVTLAVGETATLVCTGASHIVTAGDVATGTISQEAIAQGRAGSEVVVDSNFSSVSTPVSTGGIALEKIAGVSRAVVGDVVPWTITVTNAAGGLPLTARLVDVLPQGFVYRSGTARIGGVATEPTGNSRNLAFDEVSVAPGTSVEVTLETLVTSAVQPGAHTNRARLYSRQTGAPVSPEATAIVRVEADGVFQCSTVLGRVFDDRNQDGHMTRSGSEKGLPNVRLVTPNGIAILTDEHGRFSVPCAAMPRNIGGNFMLRLDERTLPAGFRLTTENPRVVRVTQGMVTRLDFGATLSRLVRIDLAANAFAEGRMRPELAEGLRRMVSELRDTPAMLRITWRQGAEPVDEARRHLRLVERELRRLWPANGRYQLNVETVIERGVR